MQSLFKKILSVFLVIVIMLCSAPLQGFVGLDLNWLDFSVSASAETEGYLTYSISNGKATITDCDTSISGDFVIPDTLGGYPVVKIGSCAFYKCRSLESITIPEGVTNIASEAFYGCTSLESITIPDSVTIIAFRAFYNCANLKTITIPEGVTSIESLFCDCSGLTRIAVDENNKYYSNDENGVLFNKNKTRIVQYPNGNSRTNYTIPEGVTSIGVYAFDNCDSLQSITIPGSVTTIDHSAFACCDGLQSITIPESVTSIGNAAFYGCTSLESITIPKGVTSISYETFQGCANLQSITISEGVTSIGVEAFYDCTSLQSITIPEGVTSIGNYAFRGCTSLQSITIPDSVTSIDYYSFLYCTSLSDVYYSGSEEQWEQISICSGNSHLTDATIHYNADQSIDDNDEESSIRNKYLQQHIDFVNSRIFDIASNDFRYATILWNNYHGSTSQAAAEFVYDIQEGFFETISFQGMSSLENPYDAIILDLLSSKSVKASLYDAVDSSAISVIDSVIGDLITTFQADSGWADDIDIAGNFKDLLDLEATDYSSNKLYQSLDKLFDGKSTNQINSMFSKYDCYSTVLGNISDLAKGVDYFLEILKYTASIEAYYSASEEFKAILKEIADVMPSVNADYGQKFNETYNNYSCCIDYNSVMQKVLNHAAEEGFWLITDLMSDVLKDSALTFCKTALKMSESAAGTLVAALWAAETGFNLGNMITENDTLINCRRLLRANYMLDEAVHHVMCTHASALKINPSYEEALNFDAAFNLYKNLQLNSLELHQKYMKANGSSFINFLLGKQDYFDREVQAKAVIINTWKTITCHDDNLINSITHSKINTVVVACPTNVYVYCKSDGKLIASVINNEVNNTDNTLTVITESNEKAICLPDLNDYEIKIEATDTGNMTVGYTVGSLERPHYDRVVLFNDVELSDKSTFVLQVDSDNESVFLVDQNQATVLPDSDTPAKHNYISEITTPSTHTTEGVKTLTCFCGDSYTEVIAKTTEHNYTTVITDPTCTEIGYTTYTCICGDTYVADYVNVIDHSYNGIVTTPATHFAEGIMTYTCSVCGDSYTEEIAKIEHTASKAVKENEVDPNCTNTGSYDSVVYCDACGEELSRETKTIEALTHSFTKYEVVEAPKCGIVGKEVSSCDNGCSANNEKEIPALEHKDADGDYLCDNGCGYEYEKPADPTPDTPDEPSETCDHLCHKDGFMGFLWKIVRFFSKLFKINPTCECGVAHY